jgi:hypothetical protein
VQHFDRGEGEGEDGDVVLLTVSLGCGYYGITQIFKRIPQFDSQNPTQYNLQFLAAQSVVFVIFVGLGIGAVKRFRRRPTDL